MKFKQWLFREPVTPPWCKQYGQYGAFRSRWDCLAYYIWTPFDDFIEFLMRHPLALLLAQIVLCAAASFATIVLLVFLKTAGYIYVKE